MTPTDLAVLTSPDQRIRLIFHYDNDLSYTLSHDGVNQIENSPLGLITQENGDLTRRTRPRAVGPMVVDRIVEPIHPLWQAQLHDRFQELVLEFGDTGLKLIARAANDGVAFRFEMAQAEALTVLREIVGFRLSEPATTEIFAPLVTCPDPAPPYDCFHSDYEKTYPTRRLFDFSVGELTQLPLVMHTPSAWLALGESEVYDYPSASLELNSDRQLELVSARAPKRTKELGFYIYRFEAVVERQNYLARLRSMSGQKKFPWRIIQVGDHEADLIGRDFVTRLADEHLAEAKQKDWSWIRPGFCTDEWIVHSGRHLQGIPSPILASLTTTDYLSYVDFAVRQGFTYIIVDDGWTHPDDLHKRNPKIDVPTIARYARERNVGVILWAQGLTVRKDLIGTLNLFKDLGVTGIIVDFLQRDDVAQIRFQEDVVREAARRQLVVSFHGVTKPTGLQIRYPNLITLEAVLGHEANKSSSIVTPRHKLDLAFVRALAGPMDYEGGSMLNAQPEVFTPHPYFVPAQGTRANELALSLIYPSALQVIAGHLDDYYADANMMDYYRGLPSTWDETRILSAKFGDHLILARRKGHDWYVAGLSARDTPFYVDLDLSFLLSEDSETKPQSVYSLNGIVDGPAADMIATDYAIVESELRDDARTWRVRLARNGGVVAHIAPGTTPRALRF